MRFLDTTTGQFVEADPRCTEYSILSHTWNRNGEQTFEDLKKIQERYAQPDRSPDGELYVLMSNYFTDDFLAQRNCIDLDFSIWDDCDLSPKIRDACAVARANGFGLMWIDSCCIDKSSSAELSEAINSMYAWYATAQVCYTYLIDVPLQDNHRSESSRFRQSVWFTRGWTLQELIAPFEVIILSQDWNVIGSKRDLVDLIEEITGISADALLHKISLDRFSVAQRLSWASKRVTTRVEDEAYSLLGIFDINMSTLYGEGARAFRRLQEEIMQRIPDQSLFAAWSRMYRESGMGGASAQRYHFMQCSSISSIFAQSPSGLEEAGCIVALPHNDLYRRLHLSHVPAPEYTSTPHGIRTKLPLLPLSLYFPPNSTYSPRGPVSSKWYLAILGCESPGRHPSCLLGRVCYVTTSESGIESLYCGMVQVSRGTGGSTGYNLFPLSSRTIEACHSQITLRTVYITRPRRTNMTSQAAVQRPHKQIHLTLATRDCHALLSQGYIADLRSPDADHPSTHFLTLSCDSHTIIVEYRHTLTRDGRNLTIHGGVTASRHDPTSSEEVSAYPSSLVWSDMLPWEPSLRWHEVTIAVSDECVITVGLGVNLVWQSYYSLDVQVLEDIRILEDHRYPIDTGVSASARESVQVEDGGNRSLRFKSSFRRLRRVVGLGGK